MELQLCWNEKVKERGYLSILLINIKPSGSYVKTLDATGFSNSTMILNKRYLAKSSYNGPQLSERPSRSPHGKPVESLRTEKKSPCPNHQTLSHLAEVYSRCSNLKQETDVCLSMYSPAVPIMSCEEFSETRWCICTNVTEIYWLKQRWLFQVFQSISKPDLTIMYQQENATRVPRDRSRRPGDKGH